MSDALTVPPAASDPGRFADWLELRTVQSLDGISSIQDLERELRRTGTTDALPTPGAGDGFDEDDDAVYSNDAGGENAERIANDTFHELSDREESCGGEEGGYPFRVEGSSICLKPEREASSYIFQLLLSQYGIEAGPAAIRGDRLFEEMSALAASVYLGGPHPLVDRMVFGSPRPEREPSDFASALQKLVRCLGTGGTIRDRPRLQHYKDDKLDVVVWRDFQDGRLGKFIGFGQCATGLHWVEKLTDLQPGDWCDLWLTERPVITPVRLFFVPHRIDRSFWGRAAILGGILFDRCRIAHHLEGVDTELRTDLREWSAHVLRTRVRA